MGVFKNNGTPKSSILIRFSMIFTIHFWGFPPILGNTHMPSSQDSADSFNLIESSCSSHVPCAAGVKGGGELASSQIQMGQWGAILRRPY